MRRLTAVLAVLVLLPAAAADARLGDRPLSRGDRGRDVRDLQRTLTALGVPVRADGIFGPGTRRRVRRYETVAGLKRDGRVSRAQGRWMRRHLRRVRVAAAAAGGPRAASRFPIAGAWRWGTSGNGFGERGGGHQGEDVFAACGTPLVAPEAGRVVFVAAHARAGHYLVVRAAGEDHVFMHLDAPPEVRRGQAVAAGQRLGVVGDTGNASACHLHFEMWTAPGWYEGGHARDPRPDLEAWARGG
jgi:murein DD-endopeptidase MepM/ murein hydrolase activator NlpD